MAELVSRVYANALFEAAIEVQNLDRIHEELGYVCQTVETHPELFELIKTPKLNVEEKKAVVAEIFGANLCPEMHNFIKILLDKRRGSELLNIKSTFDTRYHENKKVSFAKVESAVSVSKEELDALKDKLSTMTGTDVIIENVIDPTVIGGLVISIGDKVIDGSVRKRISDLKEELTQLIV